MKDLSVVFWCFVWGFVLLKKSVLGTIRLSCLIVFWKDLPTQNHPSTLQFSMCKCSNARKRSEETNTGDNMILSPPKTNGSLCLWRPCLGALHISRFLFHTKTTEDGGFDFYVSWSLLSGGDRPTVCSRTTLTLTPSATVTHIGIILNEGLCWAGSTCVGQSAMTVHHNKRGALLSAHRAAAVRGV